jgi:cyclophilin family peptidyl-prolyl cis-trans isomerase
LSIIVLCQADESYRVKFDVTLKSKTTASFIVEVHPDWAPLGAARFKELVHAEFFKSVRFFRVIDGFMAQFGIHGKPAIAAEWKEKTLMDDPVKESNKPGECIVVPHSIYRG